jgi:hypothetical protein
MPAHTPEPDGDAVDAALRRPSDPRAARAAGREWARRLLARPATGWGVLALRPAPGDDPALAAAAWRRADGRLLGCLDAAALPPAAAWGQVAAYCGVRPLWVVWDVAATRATLAACRAAHGGAWGGDAAPALAPLGLAYAHWARRRLTYGVGPEGTLWAVQPLATVAVARGFVAPDRADLPGLAGAIAETAFLHELLALLAWGPGG